MSRHRLVLTRTYRSKNSKCSIAEMACQALRGLKGVRAVRLEQQSEFEITVTFETDSAEWPLGLDRQIASLRLTILEGVLAVRDDPVELSGNHQPKSGG